MSWFGCPPFKFLNKVLNRHNPSTPQACTPPKMEDNKPSEKAMALINAQLLSTVPDQQLASPLFNKIPGEIRSQIFALAIGTLDHKHMPHFLEHAYRPGNYDTIIDIALLQTCRRIYHETRLIPIKFEMSRLKYRMFEGHDHFTERPDVWLLREKKNGQSDEQRESIQEIQVFPQQFFLENGDCLNFTTLLTKSIPPSMLCPRLKIIIPHRNWWSWESSVDSDDRLGICPWRAERTTCQEMEQEPTKRDLWQQWKNVTNPSVGPNVWGSQLQFVPGLEVLEIEMQVEINKKAQLENVVEHAKKWRLPLDATRELRWTGNIRESEWTTLANVEIDQTWRHAEDGDDLEHDDGVFDMDDQNVENVDGSSEAAGNQTTIVESSLVTYYMVSMTWDLKESRKKVGKY